VTVRIINADVMAGLAQLEDGSVHCVVTSPPYFGLRDYGMPGQIGLEPTPDAFVSKLVEVFREVRRVLRKDGTCWLNLGDSYAGNGLSSGDGSKAFGGTRPDKIKRLSAISSHSPKKTWGKPKDLLGIPWRVAFALQSDGWRLRQDIIWSKPNPMPESVTDRCTKAHEYIFMLTKSARYFYDADAIKTPDCGHGSGNGSARVDTKNVGYRLSYGGRGQEEKWEPGLGANKRSVWEVATQPFAEAHFATFPPALIEPCIKAGCPEGGMVLDPFGGSGTSGLVADRLKRNAILIELNPEYAAMAQRRITNDSPLFANVSATAPLFDDEMIRLGIRPSNSSA
jgi:DNA modification methylase